MKNEPVPLRVVSTSVLEDHACFRTQGRVRVHWEILKTQEEHGHM